MSSATTPESGSCRVGYQKSKNNLKYTQMFEKKSLIDYQLFFRL
jgi:hypothetical protein